MEHFENEFEKERHHFQTVSQKALEALKQKDDIINNLKRKIEELQSDFSRIVDDTSSPGSSAVSVDERTVHELKTLRKENKMLSSRLEQTTSNLEMATQTINRLRQSTTSLQRELEHLQDQKDKLKSESEVRLSRAITQLRSQKQQKEAEEQTEEQFWKELDFERMAARIESLETALSEALKAKQQAETKAKGDAKLAPKKSFLESSAPDVCAKLDAEKLAEERRRNADLEQRLADSARQNSTLEANICTLKAQHELEVEELQSKLEALSVDKTCAETLLAEAEAQIQVLEDTSRMMNVSVRDVHSSCFQCLSSGDGSQQQPLASEEGSSHRLVVRLRTELASAASRVEQLNAQVERGKKRYVQQATHCAELEGGKHSAQKQILDLKAKLSELENLLSAQNHSVASLTTSLDDAARDRESVLKLLRKQQEDTATAMLQHTSAHSTLERRLRMMVVKLVHALQDRDPEWKAAVKLALKEAAMEEEEEEEGTDGIRSVVKEHGFAVAAVDSVPPESSFSRKVEELLQWIHSHQLSQPPNVPSNGPYAVPRFAGRESPSTTTTKEWEPIVRHELCELVVELEGSLQEQLCLRKALQWELASMNASIQERFMQRNDALEQSELSVVKERATLDKCQTDLAAAQETLKEQNERFNEQLTEEREARDELQANLEALQLESKAVAKELKTQLALCQAELDAANDKVSTLEQQQERLQKQLSSEKGAVVELKEDLVAAEREHLVSLEQQKKQMAAAETKHVESVEQLKKESMVAERKHLESVDQLRKEMMMEERKHLETVQQLKKDMVAAESRSLEALEEVKKELTQSQSESEEALLQAKKWKTRANEAERSFSEHQRTSKSEFDEVAAQVVELTQQNEQLAAQLKREKAVIVDLKGQIDALQMQMSTSAISAAEHHSELQSRLRKELLQSKAEIEETKAECTRLQSEIIELKNDDAIGALTLANSKLTNQLLTQKSTVESLRGEISELESSLDEHNTTAFDLKTNAAKAETLQADNVQLKKQLRDLSATLEDLRSDMESAHVQLGEKDAVVGDLKLKANSLRDEVSELKRELEEKSGAVIDLRRDLEEKRRKMEDDGLAMDDLTAEKTRLAEQNGKLKELLRAEKVVTADLRDEMDSLQERQIDPLTSPQVKAQQQKKNHLHRELTQCQSELATCQEEAAQWKDHYDRLKEQMQVVKTNSEASLAVLRGENDELRKQCKTGVETVNGKVAALEEQKEILQRQFYSEKETVIELKKELVVVESRRLESVEHLKKELAAAESKNAETVQQLKKELAAAENRNVETVQQLKKELVAAENRNLESLQQQRKKERESENSETWKAHAEALEEQLSDQNQSMVASSEQLSAVQNRVTELMNKCDRLASQLNKEKSLNSDLRAEIDALQSHGKGGGGGSVHSGSTSSESSLQRQLNQCQTNLESACDQVQQWKDHCTQLHKQVSLLKSSVSGQRSDPLRGSDAVAHENVRLKVSVSDLKQQIESLGAGSGGGVELARVKALHEAAEGQIYKLEQQVIRLMKELGQEKEAAAALRQETESAESSTAGAKKRLKGLRAKMAASKTRALASQEEAEGSKRELRQAEVQVASLQAELMACKKELHRKSELLTRLNTELQQLKLLMGKYEGVLETSGKTEAKLRKVIEAKRNLKSQLTAEKAAVCRLKEYTDQMKATWHSGKEFSELKERLAAETRERQLATKEMGRKTELLVRLRADVKNLRQELGVTKTALETAGETQIRLQKRNQRLETETVGRLRHHMEELKTKWHSSVEFAEVQDRLKTEIEARHMVLKEVGRKTELLTKLRIECREAKAKRDESLAALRASEEQVARLQHGAQRKAELVVALKQKAVDTREEHVKTVEDKQQAVGQVVKLSKELERQKSRCAALLEQKSNDGPLLQQLQVYQLTLRRIFLRLVGENRQLLEYGQQEFQKAQAQVGGGTIPCGDCCPSCGKPFPPPPVVSTAARPTPITPERERPNKVIWDRETAVPLEEGTLEEEEEEREAAPNSSLHLLSRLLEMPSREVKDFVLDLDSSQT